MEKKITITEAKDGNIKMQSEGFSEIELMGIFRLYEARVRINMLNKEIKKQNKTITK